VVRELRAASFDVYDFREHEPFGWHKVNPEWRAGGPGVPRQEVSPGEHKAMLFHEKASAGFRNDFKALRAADTGLVVLPCGRSAHLEIGYLAGAGIPTAVLLAPMEPELMYRALDAVCTNMAEVLSFLLEVEESLTGQIGGEDL